MRNPDILKLPLRDQKMAVTASILLQRITGDSCAVQWDDINRFTIIRQPPEGKVVRG